MTKSVGDRWYRNVQLGVQEDVLYEVHAMWRVANPLRLGWGKLYLTNKRLIWTRQRWTPQMPRRPIVVVPIEDISGTEVRRSWFRPDYDYLLLQTWQDTYWFFFQPSLPWKSQEPEIEEFCNTLQKVRSLHETRG